MYPVPEYTFIIQEYARGTGYTSGKVAAAAALTLLIRARRSVEYKRGLIKRL